MRVGLPGGVSRTLAQLPIGRPSGSYFLWPTHYLARNGVLGHYCCEVARRRLDDNAPIGKDPACIRMSTDKCHGLEFPTPEGESEFLKLSPRAHHHRVSIPCRIEQTLARAHLPHHPGRSEEYNVHRLRQISEVGGYPPGPGFPMVYGKSLNHAISFQ